MGIEVYRGSLDSQASSTSTMIEQQLKAYESLETSLTQIENSASRLSGQAYDSFRSFVTSVVQPLKEAGVALAEATQESVKKLPASYRSEVADEDLQEEKLVSAYKASLLAFNSLPVLASAVLFETPLT